MASIRSGNHANPKTETKRIGSLQAQQAISVCHGVFSLRPFEGKAMDVEAGRIFKVVKDWKKNPEDGRHFRNVMDESHPPADWEAL